MEAIRDHAQEAGRDVAHRVRQVGEEIAEKAQYLGEHAERSPLIIINKGANRPPYGNMNWNSKSERSRFNPS